ncbi:ATP-binding cassette domain-containing protein [Dongia soli]|uniref:ATP-binding cassette domain-containing protein n=1 Tax=Dongia soli TaxID=600628 RepID=A0ABU5EG15_9PROT|nr:ATP-binding cassette domain-containing protein [Dongia soli]MDY0885355.1 ATP-binding cassette domain-containing protein [Dongia soli]
MATTAILDLNNARSRHLVGTAADAKLNLRLGPGDFALIDARDADLGRDFADLCSGLAPPDNGAVEFLGRDWTSLPLDYAQALRGRIGRVFAGRSWLDFLDAATNIMLPQLHHTRRDPATLRAEATDLCRAFGLPGLPMGRIDMLSAGDLVRASFARAFLGEPMLLLLESPLQGVYADMIPMLLNAIARARDRGAAAIWMTRNKAVWSDRSFPATQRLRLGYHGLASLRTG